MKEKIGIEKLIELLNEYERYLALGGIADRREFDGNLHYYSEYNDEYVFDHIHQRVISKKFGFIKWLVENDKIKLCPISKDYRIQIDLFGDGATYGELGGEYRILMILSISDTPIEDLISYLK